ncbi:ABC transporter ATP-binding protein [Mesorhizobium sp. INR15]|uniref:ABC transporter ATP-binding protein n=1 Tax=Mesorhizobium sp. INR15 TaxID=2654248 RepID=UPI0018967489|nr:ABC transporter ATP-binding protein [Mesorhizobium sp. INR15]QPC94457.1 ATP-binding cassette domain-containing protein [Mesorhizobium sp. INR15]
MDHIHIDGISKSFAGFKALDNVGIRIARGAIHAILGENGAGKTTLMNVLYGLYRPDAGQIILDGKPLRMASPRDAIANGIGMIHQHFMLVDSLSVTENIVLGLERGPRTIPLRTHEANIRELSRKLAFDIDATAPIWSLPMGMRQRVEILKALYRKAEVLILDEPTSVLAPTEIASFLDSLRALRAANHTILLITHKLDEVMGVADRITVMRHGKVTYESDSGETTPRDLARRMVGRDIVLNLNRVKSPPGEIVLEASGLTARNDQGTRALNDLGLTLRAGEVLGVTGVDGNGQRELGEVIAGLRTLEAGTIMVEGKDIAALDVRARKNQAGIGFIPEDRQHTGLVLDYPVATNLILRDYDRPPASRNGMLNLGYIARNAVDLVKRYDVRLRSPQQPARFLSGGNQQKVILAREIEAKPRILIIMQACKGLDVGAIEFVQNMIFDLKKAGVAVLYVSTELEHVLDVSDRIAVMCAGAITGVLAPEEATPERLGELMAGVRSAA